MTNRAASGLEVAFEDVDLYGADAASLDPDGNVARAGVGSPICLLPK
jgi:hypothetical protein